MPRATAYLYQKQMQALNYGLIRIVDELRDIVSDMHNRFGVSINGMFDEVKNSLDKCIDEALSGTYVSTRCDQHRQGLVRDVITSPSPRAVIIKGSYNSNLLSYFKLNTKIIQLIN